MSLYAGYQQHFSNIPFKAKATLITVSVGILVFGIFSKFLGQRRKTRKITDNGNYGKYSRNLGRPSLTPGESRTPYRYSLAHSDKMSTILGAPTINIQNGGVGATQLTPQQLGVMGMEALDTAVGYWEDALASYNHEGLNQFALTNVEDNKFTHELEAILDQAHELQHLCTQLFLFENSILFQTQSQSSVHLDRFSESDRRTMTSFSSAAESFVSAQQDLGDIRDFEEYGELMLDMEKLVLYNNALKPANDGEVPIRNLRTEVLKCHDEIECLAKVHCIRLAFQYLFEKPDPSAWFINVGGQLLTDLLIYAEKDPKDCQIAYDEMINFVQIKKNWSVMEEELGARGVPCLSFYDIVLDYMLMDAFEDLENPPTSVRAVIQNRWLSNGFKETALSTAVWSVLQAKRRRLKYSDGFSSHFYAISEHITPVLAWGFLGPNEDLKEVCLNFKNEVEGFIQDIFNFHKVRYTCVEDLAEDIFNVAKVRFEILSHKISL